MPIKDASGDVIGVAQVINKLNCERFSENDEKVQRVFLFLLTNNDWRNLAVGFFFF